MTPEELSLIKARYFQAILAVARSYDDASALRLIRSLATDIPTLDTSPQLAAAERAAMEAAQRISDGMLARDRNVVLPWSGAARAVQQWLASLGDEMP